MKRSLRGADAFFASYFTWGLNVVPPLSHSILQNVSGISRTDSGGL